MLPYEAAAPRRRSRWWLLVWAVLVVAITAATLVAADHGSSAADEVALVRHWVHDHPSFRFTSTSETGQPDYERRDDGEVAGPDRTHVTTRYGGLGYEGLEVDGRSFSRTLGAAQWKERPVTGGHHATGPSIHIEGEGDESGGFYSVGGVAVVDPADPGRTLRNLTGLAEPEVDGDRITFTYRNRDLLDAESVEQLQAPFFDDRFRRSFDRPVTVTVEHGPHGRLDAVTVVEPERSFGGGERTTTRYRDWGARITVAGPGAVDPTPDVEEERIAAFPSGPVLAPTDLPAGWLLVHGDTLDRDDESEDCASATLTYGRTIRRALAAVVLVEPDCPFLLDYQPELLEGTHERVGAYDAVLHDDLDDFLLYDELEGRDGIAAVVRVPQGYVIVETSEGSDVLRRLVASLAPYDSAATASATVKAPS